MDSKTKHRILGILVVAGLVVITLPFFQSSRELPAEATVVKKPPFPDQPVQVMSPSVPMTIQSNEMAKQLPDDTIKEDHTNSSVAEPTVPAIPNPAITSPAAEETPAPSKISQTTITPSLPEPKPEEEQLATVVDKVATPEPSVAPVVKKTSRVASKRARAKHLPAIHGPIDDNGLFKLQGPSYVIQVGSYKNKVNALRVVNHLRANGYRAFIQHISTSGENTRVFVGPENQQATARELATKLEQEMKLHGIVISYKPLAL